MNHALLTELQGLAAYPSITVLASTTPGRTMEAADLLRLHDLVDQADDRLHALAPDEPRASLVGALREMVESAAAGRCTAGIAICVSPEHEAVVRLGRSVENRVVIDETFATRDLVADLNRTATFRVVCVSDRMLRLLVGDRSRLVELHDSNWPLRRKAEEDPRAWRRRVGEALHRECASFEIPTVVAGVAATVRGLVDEATVLPIAPLPGNHDRTDTTELHQRTWPLVEEWIEGDSRRAFARLEFARGARMFAGGLDEVWDLAQDGRVELLVVEDDYRRSARHGGGHLELTDSVDEPGVMADAVDELIATVMRTGGETVMVPPGELRDHEHLAAVLRY